MMSSISGGNDRRAIASATPRVRIARRASFLGGTLALATSGGTGAAAAIAPTGVDLPFDNGQRALATYPQKRPLIVLTSRPVQLESPFAVFDSGEFTPNDAFFVRWHLPHVPTNVDPAAFRIAVRGAVTTPLSLTIDDLRSFEPRTG